MVDLHWWQWLIMLALLWLSYLMGYREGSKNGLLKGYEKGKTAMFFTLYRVKRNKP